MNRRVGFTLIETLTVVAIIALLAAILSPAFIQVKAASKQAVCLSHFHQVQLSQNLYIDDYDQRFPPVRYSIAPSANSGNDRTWVQDLLPYAKSFAVFFCPADSSGESSNSASFDGDLVAGDLVSRYYHASLHVNTGFNYMALSPIIRSHSSWVPAPRSYDEIEFPSEITDFVDSTSYVDAAGHPSSEGDYVVEPPCRYYSSGGTLIDAFAVQGRSFDSIFAFQQGWSGFGTGNRPYGGAWTWHLGRMTIAHVDGSVKTDSPGQLANGCDVRRHWAGSVTSKGSYSWAPTSTGL